MESDGASERCTKRSERARGTMVKPGQKERDGDAAPTIVAMTARESRKRLRPQRREGGREGGREPGPPGRRSNPTTAPAPRTAPRRRRPPRREWPTWGRVSVRDTTPRTAYETRSVAHGVGPSSFSGDVGPSTFSGDAGRSIFSDGAIRSIFSDGAGRSSGPHARRACSPSGRVRSLGTQHMRRGGVSSSLSSLVTPQSSSERNGSRRARTLGT